jgi:hypothetical protein
MQIGISWLNLDELKNYRIYPKFINQLLKNNELNKNKIYLGDIN